MHGYQLVILAAGEGKRMRSLLPKALVPFKGVTLIERQLAALQDIFPAPIIVVGHKGEEIKKALGERFTYAHQDEQRGTGHALMCALPLLEDVENVIVLAVDHPLVKPEMVEELMKRHEEKHADVSLVGLKLPSYESPYDLFLHHGRLIVSDEDTLERIAEYKDATPEERSSLIVNPSCYCFKVSWLKEHLKKLTPSPVTRELYITDTASMAQKEGNKLTLVLTDDWRACASANSPEELAALERL